MNRFRSLFCSAFSLITISLLSSCAVTETASDTRGGGSGGSIGDTAKYLAGMPGGARTELAVSRNSSEWKAHASNMDKLWSAASARKSHIRGFRSNLGGLGSGTVFYPFGGPDYLHANALFPGANTYILVGLEGTDELPALETLSASELTHGLNGISNSLRTVTGASYFITKDMKVDLASTQFRGTLPLILAMAARNGQNVSSVQAVGINSAGQLTSRSAGSACPGWHIKAGGKNIFYFKEDLSNGGLGDRRLLKFVSSKGSPTVFVKSASYLMHSGGFSSIRDYILQNAKGLVQDPSGIPYRNIVDAGWDIKLYGNYQGPIGVFSGNAQSDLAAAYQNQTHPVKPISFGLGYLRDPKTASIIVGRR